jgi:hypothetical protein
VAIRVSKHSCKKWLGQNDSLNREFLDNETHATRHFRLAGLALTNMGLGDKAAAFAFVDRCMAATPIEKDALSGIIPIEVLARVAAQMGETDRAITALQKVLSVPGDGLLGEGIPLTAALLRLDPMFDPLRNDPRFQKLCEDKPK